MYFLSCVNGTADPLSEFTTRAKLTTKVTTKNKLIAFIKPFKGTADSLS